MGELINFAEYKARKEEEAEAEAVAEEANAEKSSILIPHWGISLRCEPLGFAVEPYQSEHLAQLPSDRPHHCNPGSAHWPSGPRCWNLAAQSAKRSTLAETRTRGIRRRRLH